MSGELVQHRLHLLVGGVGVVQDADLTHEGEVGLGAAAGLARPIVPGVDHCAHGGHGAGEVRLSVRRLHFHVGERGVHDLLLGVELRTVAVPFGQAEGDGEAATEAGRGGYAPER